jgi:hypothetical protein
MPDPDVVLQLVLDDTCPDRVALDKIEAAMKAAVPLETSARSLAVCGAVPGFNNKVLSVGLWGNDDGLSEADLTDALLNAGPITPMRSAALMFSAQGIQHLASSSYEGISKRIDLRFGFIRLRDEIEVGIEPGIVRTTIKGEWKQRFVPNIPFSITIADTLQLLPRGSDKSLEATSSTTVKPGILKLGAISSLISPLLGGLIFWLGDDVVGGLAPDSGAQSAGSALAAQWPAQILTEVNPPELPGKLVFTWTDLVVDERGVQTSGIFIPTEREPAAFIQGSTNLNAELPAHSTTAKYRLATHDLRGSRHRRWSIDGVPAGDGHSQEVSFRTVGQDPGFQTREILVEVRDEDGLTASREIRVRFEVTVPAGHQPL